MVSSSPIRCFLIGSLVVHSLILGPPILRLSHSSHLADQNVAMLSYVEYPSETPVGRKEKKAVKPPQAIVTGAVRDSKELFTDPKNGKIFVNYFVKVKECLTHSIRKKYALENVGNGTVCLVFVLRCDGSLETAMVSKQQTDADETAKAFAVNCLKEAAPFDSFPKELGLERISFNVTIFL